MSEMRMEEDAKVMLEMLQHPERFCSICHKRLGVCKHTRDVDPIELEQIGEEMYAEDMNGRCGDGQW